MEDTLIKFKTAKLAEEKGFNIQNYIKIDDTNPRNLKSNYSPREYQPWYLDITQGLLQRWLREVHKIHITITSVSQESWMYRITKPGQKLIEGAYGEDFNSYEEALEDALQYSLTELV